MDKEEIESIIVNEVSCYYDGITGYGKAAEKIAASVAKRTDVDPEEVVHNRAGGQMDVNLVFHVLEVEMVPADEIWFISGNKRVARIVNIGTT